MRIDELKSFAQESVPNPDAERIVAFKKYFAELGFYFGDVNSGEVDEKFVEAIQALEVTMSNMLQKISPNAGPNEFVGRIWQNGKINPKTSPIDMEKAIGIMAKMIQNQQS